MDNNGIGDFDVYEIMYRDAMLSKNSIPDKNIADDTVEEVDNLLSFKVNFPEDISNYTPMKDVLVFSGVKYELFPKIDDKTSEIGYYHKPVFKKKLNGNASEYIDRFNKFNINNLPLIEVARFLRINVVKSNQFDEALGQFNPYENKIVLGTDYIPVFIHELAHAVDYALPGQIVEKNYMEVVAEVSTVVLCKKYSIPINDFDSLYYCLNYKTSGITLEQMILRVSEIVKSIEIWRKNLCGSSHVFLSNNAEGKKC